MWSAWTTAWLTFWAFLGLKLSGAWALSWVWVTAPLWLATVFTGLAVVALGVLGYSVARTSPAYQRVQQASKDYLHNAFK